MFSYYLGSRCAIAPNGLSSKYFLCDTFTGARFGALFKLFIYTDRYIYSWYTRPKGHSMLRKRKPRTCHDQAHTYWYIYAIWQCIMATLMHVLLLCEFLF